MKRRPEQLSILTLMGHPDTVNTYGGHIATDGVSAREPPFARFKVRDLCTDMDGNVLTCTVTGTCCPVYPYESDEDPWWDQVQPAFEE